MKMSLIVNHAKTEDARVAKMLWTNVLNALMVIILLLKIQIITSIANHVQKDAENAVLILKDNFNAPSVVMSISYKMEDAPSVQLHVQHALMKIHVSHALKASYLMVSHHAIKNVHQTA